MRKIPAVVLFLILAQYGAFALSASISYATFKSDDQAYVEVYTYLFGNSLTYIPQQDSLLQAGVEVIIMVKSGDKVIQFDKFNLMSPLSKKKVDVMDLKRLTIPDGAFTLEVDITDLQDPDNTTIYSSPIRVHYQEEGKIIQSDIELLHAVDKNITNEQFVKGGVQMEPLPFNFYNKEARRLYFYQEVYNTDKVLDDDFLISTFVNKVDNKKETTMILHHERKSPAAVVPYLFQKDISNLPTGNYTLKVEIRDRQQNLLSEQSIFFQRSNPYQAIKELTNTNINIKNSFVEKLSTEDLVYGIQAITALAPQEDIPVLNLMLKNKNVNAQRMYLFNFWAKQSPNAPGVVYDKFMEVARAVDQTYKAGFRRGFQTDRGYTYLKYGRPDDIERRETEASAPPYEIWTYNQFPSTNQQNVKFIFYNPSLVGDGFILLHSDARGERNNPNWERDLYKNANQIKGSNYFDGTGVQDNFNRNAAKIYRDN